MTNKIVKLYHNGEEYLIKEWEEPGWEPGENTLVYLPFTDNLINQITNAGPVTTRGTSTIEGGAMHCGGALYYNISTINSGGPWTMVQRLKPTEQRSYTQRAGQLGSGNGKYTGISKTSTGSPKFCIGSEGNSEDYAMPLNERHLRIVTYNGTTTYVYKDGAKKQYSNAWSQSGRPSGNETQFLIGINNTYDYYTGWSGITILENKIWTDDECTKFYNKTKKNYGL